MSIWTRTALSIYSAVVAGLASIFLIQPELSPAMFVAVGFVGAAAVAVGVRHYRPIHVWPWAMLASCLVVTAAVDCVFLVQLRVAAGTEQSTFYAADLLYGATLPAVVVALISLSRTGTPSRDRAWLIDAVTAALALAMLIWVSAVFPAIRRAIDFDTATLVVYAIGGVLLLSAVVRFLRQPRRSPAVILLVAGALSTLAANLLYTITAATHNHYQPPTVADLGWLIFFATWGGAALHPSMSALATPDPTESVTLRQSTVRRTAIPAVTSLAAPFVLLLEALHGDVRDGILIAVAGATIFLLSLTQVADTANMHRLWMLRHERQDTLTGLANRRSFTNRLATAVASLRTGGETALVLLVDIDDFKVLNDTIGPAAADEVVAVAGHRLSTVLGPHDLGARLASDEFAVLVAPSKDDGRATELIGEIGAVLGEPVPLGEAAASTLIHPEGASVAITTSIGVASTVDAETAAGVLRQAGLAARAARAGGRGRWQRYQAKVHDPMLERMMLRPALDRAVAQGDFTLVYQPIVSLTDGRTVGFEALARWDHPTRGPVPPVEFIELAEEIGLIDQLGRWVLRTAAATASEWNCNGSSPYVSVNISASQIRTPGFATQVKHELATAGLPPHRLMLELTESVLLRPGEQVQSELAAIREAGIRLAVDDFGTGFSSLSYLHQAPIDLIKIDKSFVGALNSSPRQLAIVENIARLANNLGLQIIAEGIETAADRDLLVGLGCPYGQGYLYAMPLAGDEVPPWLGTHYG